MALVADEAAYDRRAIMAEAHRAYAIMKGRGWGFGEALCFAWGRAREARQQRLCELAAFQKLRWVA